MSEPRDNSTAIATAYERGTSSLPAEILQHVFQFTTTTYRHNIRKITVAPLSLGQVCRRWRTIAHGSAELWTTVYVDISSSSDQQIADLTGRLELWLLNSASRPLNLTLIRKRQSRPVPSVDDDIFSSLLQQLIPHARRWQTIELHISEWSDIFCLQSLKSSDVPLLQEFSFYRNARTATRHWVTNVNGTPAPPQPLRFLQDAPALQALNWNDYALGAIPWVPAVPIPTMPMQRLLNLSIRFDTFQGTSLADLLSSARNLKSLVWYEANCQRLVYSDDWEPITHLILPALESLSIRSVYFCPIIDSLTLPSLTELGLQDLVLTSVGHHETVFTSLTLFFKRSKPNLRKLYLVTSGQRDRDRVHPGIDFLDCFRSFSELETLSLVSQVNIPEILHHIITNSLCPKLSHLQLSLDWDDKSSLRKILSCISARLDPVTADVQPLVRVDVDTLFTDGRLNDRILRLGPVVRVRCPTVQVPPCSVGEFDQRYSASEESEVFLPCFGQHIDFWPVRIGCRSILEKTFQD